MLKHWILVLILATAGCSGGGATPQADAGLDPNPDPPPQPQPAPVEAPPKPTSLLIMLDGDADELSDEEEEDEAEDIRGELQGLQVQRIGNTSFFVLELPAGVDLAAVLDELEGDVRIVQAEVDYSASAPEGGPDDLPTLGSDLLASIRPQPRLAELDLPQAHGLSRGAGITVAIVDTGIDFTHPYLAGRIDAGGFDFIGRDTDPSDERDFIDNDRDGMTDEQYGHGTFIASLIIAVAPDARILPIRVLDADGFGNASTLAAGIVWAADAGAQVISVSIGMDLDSLAVKEAISYANDRRAVVVAAGGNGAASNLTFPARLSDVVAVTAIGLNDVVAQFANTGSKVDLAAPGVDLIGAVPFDLNAVGTARWSGTSFATPLVAGATALALARFTQLDPSAGVQLLLQTARPIDAANPTRAGKLGAGLVQPFAALQGN